MVSANDPFVGECAAGDARDQVRAPGHGHELLALEARSLELRLEEVLNLLLVALVLGLSTWMPGWLAAVIVAAAVFIIGGIVGYVSWTRRVTTPLAATRKTLKEDVQWAKERLA